MAVSYLLPISLPHPLDSLAFHSSNLWELQLCVAEGHDVRGLPQFNFRAVAFFLITAFCLGHPTTSDFQRSVKRYMKSLTYESYLFTIHKAGANLKDATQLWLKAGVDFKYNCFFETD
ncbi:hypothetical protein DM01DRAFT_312310 [Hesseltinella vesiculosa]|uniref:Uncharacterized protein n=1 Tax=Hesseltinella vesiculosa TaxID=101127 RepID=A0A1X2GHS5_9FUNG|nr:hypothetical protein DM01DRAFT_312310 [Hesseltinella vesiculosa]